MLRINHGHLLTGSAHKWYWFILIYSFGSSMRYAPKIRLPFVRSNITVYGVIAVSYLKYFHLETGLTGADGQLLFLTDWPCTWILRWVYRVWADYSAFDFLILSVCPFGFSTLTIPSGSAGYEILVKQSRPLRVCIFGSIWNYDLWLIWVFGP